MAANVLSGRLNFASDSSAPGAFCYPSVTRVPSGETLHLRSGKVAMHDLRLERRPSLDNEGYTWLSLPFDDLDGAPGWEARYARETCECVLPHDLVVSDLDLILTRGGSKPTSERRSVFL